MFCERKQYTRKMVENIVRNKIEKLKGINEVPDDTQNDKSVDKPEINLNIPYAGKKGEETN